MIAFDCNAQIEDTKRMRFQDNTDMLKSLTGFTSTTPNSPVHEFNYKGETYSTVDTVLRQETQEWITITSVAE